MILHRGLFFLELDAFHFFWGELNFCFAFASAFAFAFAFAASAAFCSFRAVSLLLFW